MTDSIVVKLLELCSGDKVEVRARPWVLDHRLDANGTADGEELLDAGALALDTPHGNPRARRSKLCTGESQKQCINSPALGHWRQG